MADTTVAELDAPGAPHGRPFRRPDLARPAVVAAIISRVRLEGKDPALAPRLLDAAGAGEGAAVRYMRGLVLPPPEAPLEMPVQALSRDRGRAEVAGRAATPVRACPHCGSRLGIT